MFIRLDVGCWVGEGYEALYFSLLVVLGVAVDVPGQPEVADLDYVVCRQQHVARCQVTVDVLRQEQVTMVSPTFAKTTGYLVSILHDQPHLLLSVRLTFLEARYSMPRHAWKAQQRRLVIVRGGPAGSIPWLT